MCGELACAERTPLLLHSYQTAFPLRLSLIEARYRETHHLLGLWLCMAPQKADHRLPHMFEELS